MLSSLPSTGWLLPVVPVAWMPRCRRSSLRSPLIKSDRLGYRTHTSAGHTVVSNQFHSEEGMASNSSRRLKSDAGRLRRGNAQQRNNCIYANGVHTAPGIDRGVHHGRLNAKEAQLGTPSASSVYTEGYGTMEQGSP
jgi:hypothetical protein